MGVKRRQGRVGWGKGGGWWGRRRRKARLETMRWAEWREEDEKAGKVEK